MKNAALILLLLLSPGAYAYDLKDLLEEAWDSAAYGQTSSNSAETQRMGYWTGGGTDIRFDIVKPTLFNWTAPSLKKGCGGISLNWGALSFIKKDELKNLLKAVIANGTSYAFGLLIDSICSNCFSMMQDLSKRINAIGQSLRNSCEIGKASVNGLMGLADLKPPKKGEGMLDGALGTFDTYTTSRLYDLETMAQGGVTGALFDITPQRPSEYLDSGGAPAPAPEITSPSETDYFGAVSDQARPTGSFVNDNPQIKDATDVNLIVDMIDDAKALSWFAGLTASSDGKPEYQILMSMFGTAITVTTDVPQGGGATNPGRQFRNLRPLLDFDDLMKGGTVKVYKCEGDKCLETTEADTEDMVFYSLTNKIEGYIDSIELRIEKESEPALEADAELYGFVTVDGVQVLSKLLNAQGEYKELAKLLKRNADVLAAQFVYELYKHVHSGMTTAASRMKPLYSKSAIEQIEVSKGKLDTWYQKHSVNARNLLLDIDRLYDNRRRLANAKRTLID